MPHRIMIIDDEDDIRLYLNFALEDQGYETCELEEGAPMLGALERHRPDLIVLDIMMPGRSGVALYRELRRDERFRNIPVLILTGISPLRDFREHGFRNLVRDADIPDPEGFVEKPVDLERFLKTLESMLPQG